MLNKISPILFSVTRRESESMDFINSVLHNYFIGYQEFKSITEFRKDHAFTEFPVLDDLLNQFESHEIEYIAEFVMGDSQVKTELLTTKYDFLFVDLSQNVNGTEYYQSDTFFVDGNKIKPISGSSLINPYDFIKQVNLERIPLEANDGIVQYNLLVHYVNRALESRIN